MPGERKTFSQRRLLHGIAGCVLGAVFLALALYKVPLGTLLARLTQIDLSYLPLLLVLLALFFLVKTLRWALILRPFGTFGVRQVFPALMIGFAGNNVLPAHLGEFVRMYVLARQFSLTNTQVLATIALERLLDSLTILGFFATALWWIPLSEDLQTCRTASFVAGPVCLCLLALFLLAAWRAPAAVRIIHTCASILPRRFQKQTVALLTFALQGLGSLRSPRLFASIVLLSVLHWLLNALSLYLCAISFPLNASLSPVAGLLLTSVTALGVALPSPPGYVGTTQLCFVVALSPFGVPKSTAICASFYALLAAYIPITLTGVLCAWYLGFSFRTMGRQAEAEREAERQSGGDHNPTAPPHSE